MEDSRGTRLRVLPGVLAALALSDIAYRLFAREPLRRALGIETSHAIAAGAHTHDERALRGSLAVP